MRRLATVSTLAALTMLGVTLAAAPVLAAGSATLRVDPATQTVNQGAAFTVKVIANATVAVSGVQTTVTFDPAKLKLTAATRGASWDGAPILQPANMATAIATANSTGKLKKIASAFLPPDSLPAGDQDVLTLTFSATGCGQATIGLPIGPEDGLVLDGADATYGNTLKGTKATGATVTIKSSAPCSSPAPSSGSSAAPGSSAGASAGPSASAAASAAPSASADASPSPTDSMSPPSSSADAGATASLAATASPSGGPVLDPASSSGSSAPWLVIVVFAVVVLGIAGGLLMRRPKAG